MTLAIGINCPEGIILISDRKLTDIENPDNCIYEDKIAFLENSPCAFVASGITDLFRQFNRRIGILVQQRAREFKIKNEVELNKVGRSIENYETIEEPETIQGKEDIKDTKKKNIKKEDFIQPPFLYTGEHFIADCKILMEEIGEEGYKFDTNPLDLFVALNTGLPALFHIDSRGRERQITKWAAIGSGSPFVRLFFDRLWNEYTSLDESALIASLVIKFVEQLKADAFVGCNKIDDMPQIAIFLRDGRYGKFELNDKDNLLKNYREIISKFDRIIQELKSEKK